VPKASEDLPEPETPVKTTSRSRGILTEMFLRLCSRAPRTRTQPLSGRGSGGVLPDLPFRVFVHRC